MSSINPQFKPANTLQQDLFLLAKHHYKVGNLERFITIKILLTVHVFSPLENLMTRDIIFWLIKEFYVPGIILPNREDVADLLVNPGSIHRHGSVKYSHDELVVHELMDRISTMQVRKDGAWLMPFELPQVDPNVQALFDHYSRTRP